MSGPRFARPPVSRVVPASARCFVVVRAGAKVPGWFVTWRNGDAPTAEQLSDAGISAAPGEVVRGREAAEGRARALDAAFWLRDVEPDARGVVVGGRAFFRLADGSLVGDARLIVARAPSSEAGLGVPVFRLYWERAADPKNPRAPRRFRATGDDFRWETDAKRAALGAFGVSPVRAAGVTTPEEDGDEPADVRVPLPRVGPWG